MRALRWAVIAVVLVAALAGAGVASMRPRLVDTHRDAERAWSAVLQPFERHVRALDRLADAVHGVRPRVSMVAEVEEALSDWRSLVEREPTPDLAREPIAASALEGLGTRLARAVLESAGLRQNEPVADAFTDWVGSLPSRDVDAYNRAVRRHERARARFPGRLFAGVLGYEALPTLEVPAALAQLELPTAPGLAPGEGA
jgi:hypothetical protein